MRLKRIARCADIPPDRGREIDVEGKAIAVFHHDGEFYALDALCPHREGPLADGPVENGTVICPWHGWRFELKTGRNPDMAAARVRTYPVHVDGDDLNLELD